ncbi:helix-turn-helix domain-containing protein [Nocardia gamkensis]|uniref:PucR family transcriptional regulator n=1 Tax=Nocardia gamkensis TaxID=352869 RepID=UPI0034070799
MSRNPVTRGGVIEADIPDPRPPLSFATDAVDEVGTVARSVIDCFTTGVALSGGIAGVEGDRITQLAQECVRLAVGAVDEDGTEQLADAAATWARAGIPLETVLRTVHETLRASIGQLAVGGRHGDGFHASDGKDVAVEHLATAVLELLALLDSTISHAYVRELNTGAGHVHMMTAERYIATRTLAAALLSGHVTAAAARECGIEIAREYWVLALAIPPEPDRPRHSSPPLVADRRIPGTIEAELARRSYDRSLSILSVGGGTVLLPTDIPDGLLDSLVGDVAHAAGAPITATVVRSAAPDIPDGARQAHDLLDMVQQLGMTGGVYRMQDLALEYQLTRPGPGRAHLAALLDPIDEHPELLATLSCYVAHGSDRRLTARALYVHPNTVDFRLKRIAQLTGLDTAPSKGLWHLRSALVAHSYLKKGSNS